MSAVENAAKIIFADTNIWLYALLAVQDIGKSAKANAILRAENLVISTQVVNEVCVNLIKKASFSESQIQEMITAFYARHMVTQLDKEMLLRASALRERYGFSFWDSMMVASALKAGAQILYTEDMQNGLLVENSLRLVNPFISAETTPHSN